MSWGGGGSAVWLGQRATVSWDAAHLLSRSQCRVCHVVLICTTYIFTIICTPG